MKLEKGSRYEFIITFIDRYHLSEQLFMLHFEYSPADNGEENTGFRRELFLRVANLAISDVRYLKFLNCHAIKPRPPTVPFIVSVLLSYLAYADEMSEMKVL